MLIFTVTADAHKFKCLTLLMQLLSLKHSEQLMQILAPRWLQQRSWVTYLERLLYLAMNLNSHIKIAVFMQTHGKDMLLKQVHRFTSHHTETGPCDLSKTTTRKQGWTKKVNSNPDIWHITEKNFNYRTADWKYRIHMKLIYLYQCWQFHKIH